MNSNLITALKLNSERQNKFHLNFKTELNLNLRESLHLTFIIQKNLDKNEMFISRRI